MEAVESYADRESPKFFHPNICPSAVSIVSEQRSTFHLEGNADLDFPSANNCTYVNAIGTVGNVSSLICIISAG